MCNAALLPFLLNKSKVSKGIQSKDKGSGEWSTMERCISLWLSLLPWVCFLLEKKGWKFPESQAPIVVLGPGEVYKCKNRVLSITRIARGSNKVCLYPMTMAVPRGLHPLCYSRSIQVSPEVFPQANVPSASSISLPLVTSLLNTCTVSRPQKGTWSAFPDTVTSV